MLLGHQPHIRFAFGLHLHQPAGNPDRVVTEVCDRAYLPFLRALERHPRIPVALHFSGSILDRFAAQRPEILAIVRGLVARGQVEVVGGAYHEPILALIPEADRRDQIKALTDRLTELFGQRPRGMWLTERAWEPHLADVIGQAGLTWTVLDDEHLLAGGLRGPQRFGNWITEDAGTALRILPMHTDLRLLIPNAEPEDVIRYLRDHATPDGSRIAVFFDDASRFGAWADTHGRLYEEGWLDRFFGMLADQQDWIRLDTPTGHLDSLSPWGQVYIPAMSYREMAGWSLPPELEPAHARALAALGPDLAPFLGGGFIRRFLARYPEANMLHKRMLDISRRLEAERRRPERADDPRLAVAREALWRGQANEPLWHGVFGGLYLSNLRDAGWRALIEADRLVDDLRHGDTSFIEADAMDLDRDGRDEAIIRTRDLTAVVSWQGGALIELDFKPWARNVLDTLTRHPEAYHAPLVQASARDAAAEANGTGHHAAQGLLLVKEGPSGLMARDWHRRAAFMDHLLHPDSTLDQWAEATYGEQGDFVLEPYELTTQPTDHGMTLSTERQGHVWVGQDFRPLIIRKVYRFRPEGTGLELEVTLENPGDRPMALWYGNSSTLALVPGADAGQAWRARDTTLEVSRRGDLSRSAQLLLTDPRSGRRLAWDWSAPAQVWVTPIETRSQGSQGIERLFQGCAFLAHWQVQIEPGERWSVSGRMEVPDTETLLL
ncbi:MAG: alpha-amylase/4-alpha-glucanotransferase domain-containing protein [Candidatus Sericytochromatia bacterium]|nr:alpha-amylase/4-alpha-glucanotransferase domain-containing protein [Candidatus Sericytochromatia bacterium]